MKFFISIFLIFSHLFSTFGFSMEEHECGGAKSYSFYGVSLNSHCKCDHESKDHSNKCCKDKKTIVKANKTDKQVAKIFVSKNLLGDYNINIPYEILTKELVINNPSSLAFGTKHPPDHYPPLYILYNVFLI